MRNRWIRSLALSLGCLIVGLGGVDFTSSIQAEETEPNIQPWPPVASVPASPSQPATVNPMPAVILDRPVAIHDNRGMVDGEVKPTGLFNQRSESVSYSPVAGYPTARPLPIGPSTTTNSAPVASGTTSTTPSPDLPYTWQQPPAPTPSPIQGSPVMTTVPSPNSSTPPMTVVSPGIGGPIGDPVCDGCMGNGCGCCPDGCCTPGCCAPGCCDGCGWGGFGSGCCFGNRWYGSAEYLLWFIRGQPLPPLVTMGSVNDNPPGALGQPGTTILLGNSNVNNNPYSGGRFRAGYWFSDDHGLGIEGGFFFLGQSVNNFTASSLGTPFLARPFFNALTGLQDIEAVATPNGLAGTISVVNRSRLWGAEANLRSNICCGSNWYIDGLVGWRILDLTESLNIQENLTVINSTNPSLPVGSTFVVSDRFGTQNLFNGGQVGGIAEYRFGRWIVDLRTTVALGVTQQVVDIFGTTLAQAPGQAASLSSGGLLAQSSNIGRHVHDQFTVVPEVGVNLGYQFTNHIRGFVGYNFLYWSSVARPGNQIDPVVNPNLIPPQQPGGPQRPAFSFHGSDFWAQGIQFGLDIRW